jgi:hypothetical protein
MESQLTLIFRCGCEHTVPAIGSNEFDPVGVWVREARETKRNPYRIDADCKCAICPRVKTA